MLSSGSNVPAADGGSTDGTAVAGAGTSPSTTHHPERRAGRHASCVKDELQSFPDVGARCRHCKKMVRSKQQHVTVLGIHL